MPEIRRPRRPTAYEVSFPDEVIPDMPALGKLYLLPLPDRVHTYVPVQVRKPSRQRRAPHTNEVQKVPDVIDLTGED